MGTSDPVEVQNKHPRSIAHSGVFYIAIVWFLLHLICLLLTLAIFALYIFEPENSYLKNYRPHVVILSSVATSLITFIIAYIKRRSARCPLCKGTPLVNTWARPHSNAFSIPPLNHGYTAMLSITLTQKFCCMYCGTKFDLLKPTGQKRRRSSTAMDD